ncbi:MAG: DUF1566 domain-containing protein [Bacteroidetes bacterium]|nr:DUF1566 domain-containing protein [Bacteroidota bacterium]
MKSKVNQKNFLSVLIGVIVLLNMNLSGCKKDDNSTTTTSITGDLKTVPRAAAYAGCYHVIGTTQAKSWDSAGNIITPVLGEAFFGQDAQFTHTAPIYTKSSDGLTVKDEVTGLTWQKTYDSGTYYWASTQTVVDNLNNQKYGGYNDWRVPTIKELYSLWNGSVGWPYIDTEYFTITYSSEEDLSHTIFWSSDKYTGVLGNISGGHGEVAGDKLAFGVNFGTGHIKAYSISSGPKHQVRCVRGNLSYGVNLFQNNNDGTISDLATGLMWQQTDIGLGMDWEHALAYAQTLNNANYLGHNDWRLPNTKELQSLVDYTRSPYATNATNVGPAINALFSCTGILNDGGKADYPYYWTSTSAIPQPNGTYSNAWYVAFGQAEDGKGENLHGAGAVRFDAKVLGSGAGEERVLNYVRLVRNIQ